MRFDSGNTITRTADAQSFTATITESSNVCRANISYKPTFKIGPPSITARDRDTLMRELTKLDSTVKFYARGDGNTLSAKDAAALEAMKPDTVTVSDVKYRSACRNFGVQPSPRPNTVHVASKTNTQAVTPFLESATAWQEFEQAHGELWQSPYGDMNVKIILQYLQDENMQVTKANLAQAHRELKAANCFRTANTLARDMNGSLTIVQPYSHERIVALRQKQVVEVANAAPSSLGEVDREAWQAVRAKYPQLPVNSAAFRQCCADTLVLWATEYVKEEQPELAAANKRGELRAAIDRVIMLWTRNPNLGQGQKTIKDSRVWLGSIFF